MNDKDWERLDRIKQIARSDPDYQQLHRRYLADRQKFIQYSLRLPEDMGGFYMDYIQLVANMTYKQLLIACEQMRFPDEETK